ncbi:MAG: Proline/betaine transporter [Fimbriimonadaceae bacterium]|nr:Proline/betaine transporter [Fimbriimonadaceae bacterium]
MMGQQAQQGIWKVIGASSAGTLIEWYDFYIFGSLATTLATQFFPKDNPTWALLSTLATFATGFVVRPFGAIVFGRLGDVVGRKTTFLLTLLLMGGSTFAIGLLPTYATAGVLAPALLLLLRLLQGLALGGEYGGAATYVAEHSPDGRRGFYTSFIQTTATLGLFVSLGVILLVSSGTTAAEFDSWGWRIPFLLSIVLVIFSYAIRRRMEESPMFARLKSEGKVSVNPLKESFGDPQNRKLVLLALFGATAGQGVVWYTGQFYALYFLQTVLKIDKAVAFQIVAIALLLGTPFFLVFGAWSDRIGRKPIILSGMVLAAAFYVPIYMGMTHAAGWNGTASVNPNVVLLSLLILVQVLFVTMVYGPIAAFLVELFPTRIRYTSLSVPYHIGNGIFGGLVPLISTALEKGTGNMYMGLAYPIGIALITACIGGFLIKEERNVRLWDEDNPSSEPS